MGPSTLFLFGCATGLTVGVVFFGGLWWTIRYAVRSRRPRTVMLLSYVARVAAAGAAFTLLGAAGWPGIFGGALGVLGVRQFLLRRSADGRFLFPMGEER